MQISTQKTSSGELFCNGRLFEVMYRRLRFCSLLVRMQSCKRLVRGTLVPSAPCCDLRVPQGLESLLRGGAKADELNYRAHTTPSVAALVHDEPNFLDPLYSFGIDVHSLNHSGQTLLHCAALCDNYLTARWLIGRGVDVNQPDKDG